LPTGPFLIHTAVRSVCRPAEMPEWMTVTEDTDWQSWNDCALTEIPAMVLPRFIITNESDFSLWLENVRGYSRGFSFTIRSRISDALRERLSIELAPDLIGHFTDPEQIETWITVSGRRYDNIHAQHDSRRFTLLGGGAIPLLSWSEWWVPEMSLAEIEVGYRWESLDASERRMIDASGWADVIEADLRPVVAPNALLCDTRKEIARRV
jgi:hypothetical protein